MGWRGTLRTSSAAARQARLASERRERALSSLERTADSTLSKIDAETEKEIERIANYEEKICAQPAKTLGLWHDTAKGWGSVPFKEQTGVITYEIKYGLNSQAATFSPSSVELGGITLRPLAISVSQYFTAIAFEASAGAGQGGRVLKLTYPSKPEASRIALTNPRGEIFNSLDTTLDGRIFAGTSRAGVVTFEPFSEGHDHIEILLESPEKARDRDTVRIRVTSESLESDMATSLGQPSILERMTAQLRQLQSSNRAKVTAQVGEVRKKASSGCLVVIAMGGLALSALVALIRIK